MTQQLSRATPERVPDAFREVRYCPECGSPVFAAPTLKCAKCGEVFPLRAFLYRSHGRYIAECIDLYLLAQAETADDAIRKLQEETYGYLKVAFEGKTNGLVLRPSPLSHRLRYRFQCFVRSRRWRHKKRHMTWHFDETPQLHISHC